ncbi:hypothetical protein [Mesorhizobium sp.]|uniref:hypothetical protein n=1 Tax=Mesorhizobium sp. TaxID=1871066 RepID=UPI0025E1268B|nr:hypothetical protein [Mesorhizobium sp.]
MIIRLVEELSADLSARHKSAAFTDAENKALNFAIDLMAAEGMLEIVTDADSNSNTDI